MMDFHVSWTFELDYCPIFLEKNLLYCADRQLELDIQFF